MITRKNYHQHFRRFIGLVILLMVLISGCESFIEIKPPSSSVNSENVFGLNGTAISAVTEMYGKLNNANANFSISSATSSDELQLIDGVTSGITLALYRNELRVNPSENFGGASWTYYYGRILSANASLEGLLASQTLTPIIKQQLLGECYFMRAFCYFNLVNLYGDAALALTSDPNINNYLFRESKDKIYEQIVSDLIKAKEFLNPLYVNNDMLPGSGAERVRPNRSAANSLLARVYLYMGKDYYAKAEEAATEVINQTNLYGLLPLNEVFLRNSRETIWALQPTTSNRNTDDGFALILPIAGPNASTNPYYLSNNLQNAFESNDTRAILGNWINRITTPTGQTYYYPFKYKSKAAVVTEFTIVLRLAEQYLIRAEARAYLNNLNGLNSSSSDLNIIRERAGLPPINASSQQELLDAILKERRVELFTEWGHRWFDLKRTGKVDEVMSSAAIQKGSVWRNYQQLYPIPYNDIIRGPNLVQNPSY